MGNTNTKILVVMSISNKDYLNKLIAKAKKSWEGVDVERYMSDLRDDSFDKEVAENLSKEVASYITEQIKSNMDKVTIKCRDLMVGDWITNRNGFPMQITNVGEDYAYATWEGNEGDPWEFDDKDDQPQPIPLTNDILRNNDWRERPLVLSLDYSVLSYNFVKDEGDTHLEIKRDTLIIWFNYEKGLYADIIIPIKYVHQLQHALRLCELDELADNFKV